MSRVLLIASTFVAMLLGCGGPEKELPQDITTSTDRGKDVEVAAPVPAASQPQAVKFVEKCLAAATDGHPERLEKLKANRLTEQGKQLQGPTFVPTTRKIAAVWPDRFLFSDETNIDGPLRISIGLRQQILSFRRNDEPFDPGFPKGREEILQVESVGLHWMLTLVPLMDPKTVVFDAKKQTLGNQTWETVQASVPGCPAFTLWFDEKTGLLGIVSFVHMEGTSRILKRLAMSGHKSTAGVKLPSTIESERNGVTVETWTITSWEFPEKIEDAVFDQTGKK